MRICMGCMGQYEEDYQICPNCGYVYGSPPKEAYHLSPETVLKGRYIVGKTLGYGGFGVTYLGWDAVLERKVAIKEYLPGDFSTRMPNQTKLTVYTGIGEEQFFAGLKSFVEEAQRLAKFNPLPGVVDIYDSFQENGTGYIIMEYLSGQTVKELMQQKGKLEYGETKKIILAVLATLKEVHKDGIIHRDISPDNIFITDTGEIKLIDFGASRYATTLHSKSLSVILKPGYAPEEQYRSRGNQGPWSDVYAVAATFYKMITGKTPEESMERAIKDTVQEPSKLGAKLPKGAENAIMNALNVRMEDRTQSADAFAQALNSEDVTRTVVKHKKQDTGKFPVWLKLLSACLGAAVLTMIILVKIGVVADPLQSVRLPEGYVNAPGLVNATVDDAQTIIETQGLILQIMDRQTNEKVPRDLIMSQNPMPGRLVEEGSIIDVIVSAGGEVVYVPDVTYKPLDVATGVMEALGFRVQAVEEYGEAAPGTVLRQDVPANTELPRRSIIQLVASKGLENLDTSLDVEVPDLTGKTFEKAREELLKSGLYLMIGEERYDMTIPASQIISQNPGAAKTVKAGSTVSVVVSLGVEQIRVADVVYKPEADALEQMHRLLVDVIYEFDDIVAQGNVISQSIEPGSLVDVNTKITLHVSLGRAVTMPNLVGKTKAEAESALSSLGLKPSFSEQHSNTVASGRVISQNIDPGQQVGIDTEVAIVISKGKAGPDHIPVTEVKLDIKSLSLTVNETRSLTATVLPSNATIKGVSWSSNNSSVAKVDSSGRVTAIGPGSAKITVTTTDSKKTAVCDVTVTQPVTGVKVNPSSITIYTGQTTELTAAVQPVNATNKNVSWSSSDTGVATVTNGVVKAVSAGNISLNKTTLSLVLGASENLALSGSASAKITVTTQDGGKTDTCTVTVLPDATWSSSNTSVATVDSSGRVSAVGRGTATITVSAGGKTVTCTVTVNVPVTGVSLNKTSGTLYPGDTETLTATVSPSNATNKSVTWKSSNTGVATVSSSGIVTAVSAGSATITVTTQDGNKTASYSLTVKPLTKAIQLGAGQYGVFSPAEHLNNRSNGTTVYEFEFYTGSTIPANGYIFRYYNSGSTGMGIYFNSSKQLAVHMRFESYNGTVTATSTTFQPNTFYKIRVELTYPSKKIFINGVQQSVNTTGSTGWSQTVQGVKYLGYPSGSLMGPSGQASGVYITRIYIKGTKYGDYNSYKTFSVNIANLSVGQTSVTSDGVTLTLKGTSVQNYRLSNIASGGSEKTVAFKGSAYQHQPPVMREER